jgi:hypothetical protein
MSTLTVYPESSTGGPGGDGIIRNYQTDVSFATLRNATDGTTVVATDASYQYAVSLNAHATTTDYYKNLRRVYLCFDTSALPGGSIIDSVTLTVYSSGHLSNNLTGIDDSIDVVEFTGASVSNPTTADYDQFGETSFANIEYASWDDTDTNPNVFTFNSDGIEAINYSGVTALGLRLGCDRSGTMPTGWTANGWIWYGIYFADSGGAEKPKLVITYHAPARETGTITPDEIGYPFSAHELVDFSYTYLAGRLFEAPDFYNETAGHMKARLDRCPEIDADGSLMIHWRLSGGVPGITMDTGAITDDWQTTTQQAAPSSPASFTLRPGMAVYDSELISTAIIASSSDTNKIKTLALYPVHDQEVSNNYVMTHRGTSDTMYEPYMPVTSFVARELLADNYNRILGKARETIEVALFGYIEEEES